MIEHLWIEGFRGIKSGEVAGLEALNVFVGPNNSGKSTVLEALYLAESECDARAFARVAVRRGWVGPAGALAMAPQGRAVFKYVRPGSTSAPAKSLLLVTGAGAQFQGGMSGQTAHVAFVGDELRVLENHERQRAAPPPPRLIEVDTGSANPEELESAISAAEIEGRRASILDLLRPLLPGLRDLRILKPEERYTLYVEDENGAWPAIAAGDGFKRLLLIAARLADVLPQTLVLMEEPEAHQHPRSIAQLSRLLWEIIQRPAQVAITTHSLELIDAIFLSAEPEKLKQSALFRLSLSKGELRAIRVPGEKVRELRAEIDEDLRR